MNKIIVSINEVEATAKVGDRIELTEAKDIIKVGLPVRTNGDGSGVTMPFEGIVGEVYDNGFYVFSNTEKGSQGLVSPFSRGFKYASRVKFESKGWVEILGEIKPFNPQFVLAVNGDAEEYETMDGVNMRIARLVELKADGVILLDSLTVYGVKDRKDVEFTSEGVK